ncbi:hypothetical protein [Holospora curviuscula]|uniref:Uncharacterized protein n=1 Tax=Holospora curviuscula TaxID=1082868 RepID=A0A2S5R9N2_9PROT|nr:hypothetical protein [Holospora curviuscula]PPE04036.1 hypothetical protein HCUR_00571 [Holospora curviuscula]
MLKIKKIKYEEIAWLFNAGISCVYRRLKKLDFTYKKFFTFGEACEEITIKKQSNNISPERLV